MLSTNELREQFWNIFIVDALIGNGDRHNDNWGILKDRRNDELSLAPIFACGSTLYPQTDEATMHNILTDANALNARIFDRPLSAIKQNGCKISYFDFISSLNNNDCNAALARIVPRIDLYQIKQLIDKTPYITILQKQFYYTIIKNRKERILDFSLDKFLQAKL